MRIPPPNDLASFDRRLTADRQEVKYRVDGAHLDQLTAALNRQLPRHRFVGEGANALPDPQHFATTVYFDTPARGLFRAAAADLDHNLKLRVREYYDLHPSLVELATDPAQIVRYQPWVWFELKVRQAGRTTKERVRLLKRDLPGFLAAISAGAEATDTRARDLGAAAAVPAAAVAAAAAAGDSGEAVQVIAETCRGLGEPLAASCLVNYRRLSWQSPDGDLRVTVDRQLAFFAPPVDLWAREQTWLRSTLGPTRGAEAGGLLEIKHRAPLPPWVAETLSAVGASAAPFSKFVAASAAVGRHG